MDSLSTMIDWLRTNVPAPMPLICLALRYSGRRAAQGKRMDQRKTWRTACVISIGSLLVAGPVLGL